MTIRLKIFAQLRDGSRHSVVEYRGQELRQLLESTELVGPFFRALFYGDAPPTAHRPSSAHVTGASLLTPLLKDVAGWRRGDSLGALAQEDAGFRGKRTHAAVQRLVIECLRADGQTTVSEYHRRYKIDDILNESEETVGQFFRAHTQLGTP